MQKLKMFIVGVLFSFAFTVSVFAGVDEDQITVMPVHNTSKFYVSFADDVEAQDVVIKIRTKTGKLIYTDILVTNRVTKVYDMSEYGKGVYEVEVNGIDFTITKEVELGKKAGFNAEVIKDKDHLELIYLSRDSDLDIYIKDENGNVLYQGEGKFGKYQQAFDVSHLPKGNYSLKVTNGDQVFEEVFEVN